MLWVLLSIPFILIFAFFLFVVYVAYRLVNPPRLVRNWTPSEFGADYQNITLHTKDGVMLRGWHIPLGRRCVLLLHGYTRSRWDDVYMKPMMKFFIENNFSILTFDFRAHGESEGKYSTVGDKEFLDLKAAVDYAREKYEEIYIIGYSMAGFLALKAASQGLAKKVVADSPVIYVDKTGARGLKYFANLPTWLYIFVKPFALIISRANYGNIDPFKFIGNITIPVLIISGRNDPLVKMEEVEELAKLNPNISLWITDAAHVRTIQVQEEEYKKKILEFLS